MHTSSSIPATLKSLLALATLVAAPAWADSPASQAAQGSIRSLFAASGHAVMAVGNVVGATLAVSAVPLAIGGSVLTTLGQASTAASGALATPGAPLPVTDEVISVTPPAQALRSGDKPAADPLAR